MRRTDARQQPRDDRMIEQLHHFEWTKLHCEQNEVGNVFNVPLRQCRKDSSRFELVRPNRCDERTIHFATFHLIEQKFTNSAVVADARPNHVRIQQTDITAFLRSAQGGKRRKCKIPWQVQPYDSNSLVQFFQLLRETIEKLFIARRVR